jgi:multidrug efflux pump subunit AcrB
MIAVEMMIKKLEEGCDKVTAATFAYTSTAFPMLTGTLVTIAGFVPVGFAASSAGEYTFTLFAVVGIALIASWRTVDIAVLLKSWNQKTGGAAFISKTARRSSIYSAINRRVKLSKTRARRLFSGPPMHRSASRPR